MIPQIAYTNSNCSDLWEMFINQNRKHTTLPLCIVSDEEPPLLELESFIRYSNDAPYYKVWTDAVEFMDDEYFIYLQEDFILYDNVDQKRILDYVKFLEAHPEYSFIRLLKVTSFGSKKLSNTLYEIESSNKNVFSMQPTIWRSSDYIKLMDRVKENKWLETPAYRKACMKLGLRGAYHYWGEPKAGKHHYDSGVYPYIATAIVKGKWNISEYGHVLYPLLEMYGIDPKIRGFV